MGTWTRTFCQTTIMWFYIGLSYDLFYLIFILFYYIYTHIYVLVCTYVYKDIAWWRHIERVKYIMYHYCIFLGGVLSFFFFWFILTRDHLVKYCKWSSYKMFVKESRCLIFSHLHNVLLNVFKGIIVYYNYHPILRDGIAFY